MVRVSAVRYAAIIIYSNKNTYFSNSDCVKIRGDIHLDPLHESLQLIPHIPGSLHGPAQ